MLGVKSKSKDGDPRVGSALEQLDIRFEIDADGDFKFGFNLKNGRSQFGFISSTTEEFAGEEIREVFSVGLKSFGPFDARTCNFLLELNSKLKIGAWSTVRDAEDNHLAIFRAKIAADLSGDLLMSVITAVWTTADEIEERLSGRDDF